MGTTALGSIAILALEQLIKDAPDIAKAISGLFAKGDVTQDQIAALRADIASQTFESLVPNAATNVPPTV